MYFQSWCLRATQGARPDIRLLFRGQIHRPWFRERLARHDADLAPLLDRFPRGFGTPEVRFEPGVKLTQLGVLRPQLVALGLTLGIGQPWIAKRSVEQAFSLFSGADPDSGRNEAFFHAQHLEHIIDVSGPSGLAEWHLDRLRALSPEDPWVMGLDARLKDAGL